MHRLGLFALVGLGAGCTDLSGPDRGNPELYAFRQSVQYGCNGWAPARPQVSLGLFDIYWGRSTEQDADDGPRAEHLRRVLQVGGTIVHKYHVTMVRAILPPSAVPVLGANAVRGVTDSRKYNTAVFVGFRSQIDQNRILARGGTITHVYSFGIAAVLPDAAIPSLRRDPSVSYVESSVGTVCLQN